VLKFFRKYNKWILGVGGSLLMIIFLIQPVMSMFTANPDSFVLGEFEGGEITRGDHKAAAGDMMVIRPFGLLLDPDGGSESDDAMRWALILKDAQRLGLSASLLEVEQLKFESGKSDADMEMMASRVNATPGYIRHAMRNWLIVQSYKELLAAQSHLSGHERASMLRQMMANRQGSGIYQAMAYGTSRLSRPMIDHFLQDQGARVTGRAVLIRADQFLDDTPKPDEAKLQELFDKYKDALPGDGEPYGFGYRVPDRVKLEYLAISMDGARQHVKVTEADALSHYRKYPERFSGVAAAETAVPAQPKPYESVRDQVIEDLTDQLAFEMVEKMAKAAYGLLYEDTRGMAKEDDYRVIENMASLRSLREVAEQMESEYGLLAEVRSSGGDAWVNARDLSSLSGIGQSRLADNLNVDFTSFVLSSRELKPETDNPLLPRRLQVGLAGAPMMDMYGSRYVFRLTAATPTRLPESLDEVREQVGKDAWLLASYDRLQAESDSWLSRVVEGGLEDAASGAETTVVALPPTPRRVPLPNGLLVIPPLPSIGQSDAFIEAFFSTANAARAAGKIAEASAQNVTGIVGIDPQLALVVYRVDEYEPMSREQFQEDGNNPLLPVIIDTTVLAPARYENPLSFKSLSARMKFDAGTEDEEQAEAEATQESGDTEQDRPGSDTGDDA
jgi:hypothetical protein